MSSCLMVGMVMLSLAGPEFRLEWQHSVEHVVWRESWAIQGDRLVLQQAAVKGSGAGMDPGPDAVLRDGWWVWVPRLPPQPGLLLAASGATDGGWSICDGDECHEFGAVEGKPIHLRPCISQSSPQ